MCTKFNLIIPLGGIGSRFAQQGYQLPKPFIRAQGKEILFRVLDGLQLSRHLDKIHQVIIVYNYQLNPWKFQQRVNHYWRSNHWPEEKLSLIEVPYNTKGALETIYYGLSQLSQTDLQYPLMAVDGDTVYTSDLISHCRQVGMIGVSGVICFKTDVEEPIYSYVKFQAHPEVNRHKVVQLAEKRIISPYANSGCYLFDSGNTIMTHGPPWLAQDPQSLEKGEYYTSSFLDYLRQWQTLYASVIDFQTLQVLGTPLQLQIFSNSHQQKPLRICFDLDGTLVTAPTVPGDYRSVQPIKERIEFCRHLKSLGHTIIIYTARRMRTWSGNQGKVMADIAKVTFQTLDQLEIPYDEVYFGKPYAHVYIDDLACQAYQNLEQALGFYQSSISQRVFHHLQYTQHEVIKTAQGSATLAGEYHWYVNCPAEFRKYIPRLIDGSPNRLVLERIQGISLTNLLVNQTLSAKIVENILSILYTLHHLPGSEIEESVIYHNYGPKLTRRYQMHRQSVYQDIPQAHQYYQRILDHLRHYEQVRGAKIGLIHGDPVLTNWIIDNQSQLRTIDMRGRQGQQLTMMGDCLYDYAKLYQSLTGYDHILKDRPLTMEVMTYLRPLQQLVEKQVVKLYGPDYLTYLQIICASLYFSLIPLHPESKKKHNLWAQQAYHLLDRCSTGGSGSSKVDQ